MPDDPRPEPEVRAANAKANAENLHAELKRRGFTEQQIQAALDGKEPLSDA